MIAALFVETGGAYFGLPDVDPWDEARDARKYAGPWPVVAHPPCSRWCRLAGLGATSAAMTAVASPRRLLPCGAGGGVLEHPAYSDAWAAHDIPRPLTASGWIRDIYGGWSCYVEQGRYGHPAKKATWLYMFGAPPPTMLWGHVPDAEVKALVSWCENHVKSDEKRPRVGKARAAATPPAFREALLTIARSVRGAA